MAKKLMKGNEVLGEAAIMAGCRFYFGYPITPQNEVPDYMSRRMPEVGGTFIQAESEIAAINMVLGAGASGARVLTTSSSPGMSLKQEAISYMAGSHIPCVIANVMRGGPGLGNINPSQGDYFQATKGGGHGDYHIIVLAPSSVQEIADLMYDAFDLADLYRMPVLILADGALGQMMELVELPKPYDRELPKKDWATTGAKGRQPNVLRSFFMTDENGVYNNNLGLQQQYREIQKKEVRFENYQCDDAELVVVSYGTISRIVKSAITKLRKEGIKIGLLRPITLWPFPTEQIQSFIPTAKNFMTVEMSFGQMHEDVRLALDGKRPSHLLGRGGGAAFFTEQEIINFINENELLDLNKVVLEK